MNPMTATPRRIQLKRTKGWRMPEGAVYVGRPSRWGNPYIAWPDRRPKAAVEAYREDLRQRMRLTTRQHETYDAAAFARWLAPLRGRDLACWCPLDQPCHADVLLELANR